MESIDGVLNFIDSIRSFDRSVIIFKLKDRIFSCAHIISCKNANKVLTKNLKYLHKNNTGNCGKNDKKR